MAEKSLSKIESGLLVQCASYPKCSGCDYLELSHGLQKDHKLQRLRTLFNEQNFEFSEIEFVQLASSGLRDRLDFQVFEGRFGLFDREREMMDLPDCAQLSPELSAWHSAFRKNLPPVRRLSVRLRVSPSGQRGMWLDLANLDAKALLDEQAWLRSWGDEDIVIEMGQRRKHVVWDGSRFRLDDPVLHAWSETVFRDEVIPLYGVIGGFTQPSHLTNRWITEWFQKQVLRLQPLKIVEFGAGNGNLSFPALSGEAELVACEFEGLALEGFQRSLNELMLKGVDLRSRVRIREGDFLKKGISELQTADLLIANPPRSGLKAFLDPLEKSPSLKHILYMSCHPESFAEDLPRLREAGFTLRESVILDQFPQTKHMEVLNVFSR